MAAAKKRGQHIGRPRALSLLQLHHLDDLLKAGHSNKAIAGILGVSPRTIGREKNAVQQPVEG